MSGVRKFFYSNLESNLFNQIALFSGVGLSASLALVLTCDLRIDYWI
jgi:hypothetical protein